MTKQQKIGACLGGVCGVCALVLGWFLYSAYADYQAALEGDEEEGTEGLIAAKEKNNKFYTQSNPFPSTDSINQIESNKAVYASWIDHSVVLAARGDLPPPPSDLDGTVFKQSLFEQVTKMQKLPGGVGGRICADKFWFGFDQYLGEAGKTPERIELPLLHAQFIAITNVVDLLHSSGVLEIRKIERVAVQMDDADDPSRGGSRRKSGKGKTDQKAEADSEPKHFDFNLEYVVRASAFVKVLNGLAKSPRFYVVGDFSFEHEGESLKSRLDRAASASAGGGSSSRGRRGRGRDRDQEKSEEAESGVVTNPETTPILVRMKLSVYDFGKSKAYVEGMLDDAAKDAAAGAAKDAAAPSQKEGK
ncbi:MAG: Amuc_1100 family pilus-like protein [Kiritimatiellae bacterium]|nr:Amuc_1100 family pilus-like protein [Kiritimatiellia bacterium]